MFEQATCAASSPEVIARFDELFERRYPSRTTESVAFLDRIGASWRAQNRAAAASFVAIGELFAYRADGKTQNTETEPEFDSFTKPLVTFTPVNLIDIVG